MSDWLQVLQDFCWSILPFGIVEPFTAPTDMRLSGLSLHSLCVHFPVALLPLSLMWDAIGIWTGSALWWAMSFWTLVVGLIAALPTIVTGFMEYARLSPDSPAEPTATRHLLLTGAAITAFLVSLLVRGAPDATLQNARLVGALACSGVGGALLAAGGHLGAVLVFRYGVGVSRPGEPSESRPQV